MRTYFQFQIDADKQALWCNHAERQKYIDENVLRRIEGKNKMAVALAFLRFKHLIQFGHNMRRAWIEAAGVKKTRSSER